MISSGHSSAASSRAIALAVRVVGWLDRFPYALIALSLRAAVATVFWNSGTTKLANWDTTLALFADEYKLPLIPAEIAAPLSASIELTTPVLLVLGLLTRPAAVLLLGLTAIIEIFVYPLAWPTHIQWAAMLLVLLFRGAGSLSLDHLIGKWLVASAEASAAE